VSGLLTFAGELSGREWCHRAKAINARDFSMAQKFSEWASSELCIWSKWLHSDRNGFGHV
jgi:hypothetical protein